MLRHRLGGCAGRPIGRRSICCMASSSRWRVTHARMHARMDTHAGSQSPRARAHTHASRSRQTNMHPSFWQTSKVFVRDSTMVSPYARTTYARLPPIPTIRQPKGSDFRYRFPTNAPAPTQIGIYSHPTHCRGTPVQCRLQRGRLLSTSNGA